MIIQGKLASAKVYANIIEDAAVEQIRRMCDYDFTSGSRIRIMPDVHAGKGCTVGTTMTVADKAVPNIVGVDIGCGMYTIRLNEREIDFARLDAAAHYVPSGNKGWAIDQGHFDLTPLRCFNALAKTQKLERSLGTLGGGNHFIEVDQAADGTLYLVVHSGSRNLGVQVAGYYQKLAVGQCRSKNAEVPDDLCWLEGDALRDYLHDVVICQQFAWQNRELIASVLLEKAGLSTAEAFHTVHNYINTDEMILRKGAIAAHAGEKVLIPINMRDGSILAVGKGNPDWNYSAPHGAGRLLSRSAAKAALSVEDYRAAMAGVYTTSVGDATLDEAPMAYKSLKDIVDVIRDTVDIIDVMKPVYNFKASD